MQNDIRPSPQDPVVRMEFSHPAESAPMAPVTAQHVDMEVHFSADTDTHTVR